MFTVYKLSRIIYPQIQNISINFFFNLGLSHEQNRSTNHRVKRFLDKPILRPDDKDNTPTCNQCDEDLGYCDIVSIDCDM